MKTENNLGNKAKFFAQYWGQDIAVQGDGGGSGFIYDINEATICDIKYDFLHLKPLSLITDEDAINGAIQLQNIKVDNEITDVKRYDSFISFCIIHNACNFKTNYSFFHWSTNPYKILRKDSDYLRSKGYALPWMDLSVEDLIEYGWIKLKGEK